MSEPQWPADRRPRLRKAKRGDEDKRAGRKKERTAGRSGWYRGTASRRKGQRVGRTRADALLYYEHLRAPPPKRSIPARMGKVMKSCMDRGCNCKGWTD